MAQTHKCEICKEQVHELGAFVKLMGQKYAHLICFKDQVTAEAFQAGVNSFALAQAEEVKRRQEELQVRVRQEYEKLARCTKCGIKTTNDAADVTKLATLGEVRVFSSAVPGRCMVCVREEAQARQVAKGQIPTCVRCKKPAGGAEHPNTCDACWNSDAPTKSIADAVKPIEKMDETLKRFSLLELD